MATVAGRASLAGYLRQWAVHAPTRVFLEGAGREGGGRTRRSVTYSEAAARIEALTAVLRERCRAGRDAEAKKDESKGEARPMVVVVAADASGGLTVDHVLVMAAARVLNYVVCPLHFESTPAQRRELLLQRLAPVVVLATDDIAEMGRRAADDTTRDVADHDTVGIEAPSMALTEEEEEGGGKTDGRAKDKPPATPMYVCFTSGSTGAPKGVVGTWRALEAYARERIRVERVTPASRILLASSATFDPSLGDIATAVVAGCTLCVPAYADVVGDLHTVLNVFAPSHVTTTPLFWAGLPVPSGRVDRAPTTPAYPSIRVVSLGGEATPPAIVDAWAERSPTLRLYSVYGVTEATVYQMYRLQGRGGGAHTHVDAASAANEVSQQPTAPLGQRGGSGGLLGAAYRNCRVGVLLRSGGPCSSTDAAGSASTPSPPPTSPVGAEDQERGAGGKETMRFRSLEEHAGVGLGPAAGVDAHADGTDNNRRRVVVGELCLGGTCVAGGVIRVDGDEAAAADAGAVLGGATAVHGDDDGAPRWHCTGDLVVVEAAAVEAAARWGRTELAPVTGGPACGMVIVDVSRALSEEAVGDDADGGGSTPDAGSAPPLCLHLLGRRAGSTQVKIHGRRVDLLEITRAVHDIAAALPRGAVRASLPVLGEDNANHIDLHLEVSGAAVVAFETQQQQQHQPQEQQHVPMGDVTETTRAPPASDPPSSTVVEEAGSGVSGAAAATFAPLFARVLVYALKRALPPYLVPSRVLVHPEGKRFATTTNGKLDVPAVRRTGIAVYGGGTDGGGATAGFCSDAATPAAAGLVTLMERVVDGAWREELLGGGATGRAGGGHFAPTAHWGDVGGDSLSMLRVVRRVRAALEELHQAAFGKELILAAAADVATPATAAGVSATAYSTTSNEARFGMVTGVFDPAAFLTRPVLRDYAAFLREGLPQFVGMDGGDEGDSDDPSGAVDAAAGIKTGAGAETASIPGTTRGTTTDQGAAHQTSPRITGHKRPRDVPAGDEAPVRGAGTAGATAMGASGADATGGGDAGVALLNEAARSGWGCLVEVLVTRCAVDCNGGASRAARRMCPLHFAAREGRVHVAATLLRLGAGASLVTEHGVAPVHLAAGQGHAGVLAVLFASGKVPRTVKDANKQSLVHHAARGGHVAAMAYLAREGVVVESYDRWGRSPLHWAVINNKQPAVAWLLARGVSVNVTRTNPHKTRLAMEWPLDIALRMHPADAALADILRAAGGLSYAANPVGKKAQKPGAGNAAAAPQA